MLSKYYQLVALLPLLLSSAAQAQSHHASHDDDVTGDILKQFELPPIKTAPPGKATTSTRTTLKAQVNPSINNIVDSSEIISPTSGSTLTATTTFEWSDEAANQYLFRLSAVACFQGDIVDEFSIPGSTTSYTVNNINPNQILYASIWAQENAGQSYFTRDCAVYNTDTDGDGIYNELDPNPSQFNASQVYLAGDYRLTVLPTGRVASLRIPSADYNQLSNGDTSDLDELTTTLYEVYEDSFDFIFITNDQNSAPASYLGRYHSVQNNISGIGSSIFSSSNRWGSDNPSNSASNDGRLQGVIHFPDLRSFSRGPGLHELAHRWANRLSSIPNGGSHWGYSSGGGQLGGWAPGTLETVSGNLYSANNGRPGSTSFGTFANGGNGLPYSNIELYVMGMIPFSQLTTMQYAVNPVAVSSGTFTADSIVTISPAMLQSNEGVRVPNFANSQKSFNILNIIVTTGTVSLSQLGELDKEAYDFSLNSDQGSSSFNFWEATNGLGTLDMALAQSELKPDAPRPPTPPTSTPDNSELCFPVVTASANVAVICL